MLDHNEHGQNSPRIPSTHIAFIRIERPEDRQSVELCPPDRMEVTIKSNFSQCSMPPSVSLGKLVLFEFMIQVFSDHVRFEYWIELIELLLSLGV